MHVTQGSATYAGLHALLVPSDPSRVYLAIFQPSGTTTRVHPGGFPTTTNGYFINNNYNYIEFLIADHPGIINMEWWFVCTAPATVDWLAVSFKPEE
jgi:hypothetical protein